jgi:hypothetical protein
MRIERTEIMENAIKVLFIGNSHTYFNDMAYMLKYFSIQDTEIPAIDPVMLAHPYKTLGEHKTEPEIRFNILFGGYDYIVLQQGAHPFLGEEVLIKDASAINEFIKETNSKAILYMTWAENAHPEKQPVMTEAYYKLAEKIDALVAPVGLAFGKVKSTAPQIELFDEDGGHASVAGSYLAAILFYCVIYKKSPLGLPNKIMFKERCLYEIDREIAGILQKIAWEIMDVKRCS